MRLYDWDSDDGNGCDNRGPSSTVPSPMAPWQRPVVSPKTNSLSSNGTIDLRYDVTYLNNLISNNNGATPPVNTAWNIVLPNGNYLTQVIRIYIPSPNIATSPATWVVTGTFAGFTNLTFNNIGTSAMLEWDGFAWNMVAGNAIAQ